MTHLNAIFTEVITRLMAIGDAAETELMPSADPVDFPARHVFDGGHNPIDGDAFSTTYQLDFTVEGYLQQAGGAETHAALNDFYAATVRALVSDPPLGGLVETIDEGAMRVVVAPLASQNRLAFALDLSATFATRRDDPAQPA